MPDSSDIPRETKVFISYARKDDWLTPFVPQDEHTYHLDPARSFTRQMYTQLTAAGFDVWWDRESMPNRGLTFLNEIRNAITACDYLVYVSGAAALETEYVRSEWQYAHSICKPVIPVLRNGDFALIPAEIRLGHAPDMRNMAHFDAKAEELIRLLTEVPRLGTLYGVPNLPDWHIARSSLVQKLQDIIQVDANQPVVATEKQKTVALHGMGGIGKSTAAAALCRLCEIRFGFPDGIFWLELGKTPSLAARQRDIGIEFGDVREEYLDDRRGKSRLSQILENKAALIVLDDVWDYRHVDAFRVQSPRSRILVTTRRVRLAAQLGAESIPVDILSEDEGTALIGQRLGRKPDEENPFLEDEKAIVRLLGGHTLAISIAAARISEGGADYTPRFRERLEQRRKQGGSPLGDLKLQEDDKNYNLELSLSESYEDLSQERKTQFRALGVFAADGTFNTPAAQAVWNLSDAFETEDVLQFFVKMSLLSQPERGRFVQHGLLRDYARALSAQTDTDEMAAFQRLHFLYYHGLHSDYDRNADEKTHPEITLEWPQILQAIEWGLEHEAVTAVDWVHAVEYYMRLGQPLVARLVLFERTLSVAQSHQYLLGQASTLNALGDIHFYQNQYPQAVDRYQLALDLFIALGNRLGQACMLEALGNVYSTRNQYPQAVDRYQQAFDLFLAGGDRLGQANTLQALGEVNRMQDQYPQAVDCYQQALDLFLAVGSRLGQANTLKALGDVHLYQDQSPQAVDRYQQALDLFLAVGSRLGQANTLKALGDVHFYQDQSPQAVNRYQQALDLFLAISDRLGQATTLQALGDVHLYQDQFPQAVDRYQRALELARSIGNLPIQLNALPRLALIAYAQQSGDQACEFARRFMALADSHPHFKHHPMTQKWREEFESWGCVFD